ncbi:MAG: hypothetical protein ACTHU0_00775 [Kofleriaceae bacterium]
MRIALLVGAGWALAGCGDIVKNQPDAALGECTATTEATDCGAHEVCDESGPRSVCTCAPAYVENAAGACEFGGAPLDPQLQDPTKWQSIGTGAAIDPAATGNQDPGELVIDGPGMCTYASIKQTFTMPPYERAEPLKAVVTYALLDPMFVLFTQPKVAFGIGNQWFEADLERNTYLTKSFCLGPAAFGGPVDFRIGTLGGLECGDPSEVTIRVDQMVVRKADPGECPAPGSIENADFESPGGWSFVQQSGGTGAIVPTGGENGTAAARLTHANRCSEISMTGNAAFPAAGALPNPAIDVYWSSTAFQGRLVFQIDGRDVATLAGDGTAKHSRICVPAWAQGTIGTLGFLSQRVSNNGCSTPLSKSFTIDNLSFVSDPMCSTTSDNTDPGFERIANATGPVTGWGLINTYVNDIQGTSADVINAVNAAHSGLGVLLLQGYNDCGGIEEGGGGHITLRVPPAQGAAGPAIKLWSQIGANPKTETRATLLTRSRYDSQPQYLVLPETGVYTQSTLCVPPNLIGRRIGLRLTTGDYDGGGCASVYNESALIDDVEITTDASCPAQ